MNTKCPNRCQRPEVRIQFSRDRAPSGADGVPRTAGSRWSAWPRGRLADRGQRAEVGIHHSALSIHHSAFTLIELLVTIAIIVILAGIALGALRYARVAAAEAKTKATIAKLNDIIIKQYESYMTRRVPINTSGMTPAQAARARLDAIRDLMRMEMPERWTDIEINSGTTDPNQVPYLYSWGKIDPPALLRMYFQRLKNPPGPYTGDKSYGPAKCLYMIVSMAHPEAMEQFSQDEIKDINGDGYPVFVDGWGMPIMFLRWAPGFSSGDDLNPNPFNPSNPTKPRVDVSDIQTGNPVTDHDPFDTRNIEIGAFHLTPLIYSAGLDKEYGLVIDRTSSPSYTYNGDPYDQSQIGVSVGTPENNGMHFDNIHNHHIEQQ